MSTIWISHGERLKYACANHAKSFNQGFIFSQQEYIRRIAGKQSFNMETEIIVKSYVDWVTEISWVWNIKETTSGLQ